MKNRKRKKIGINEPGRAQYLQQCMDEQICPDCWKTVTIGPRTTDLLFHVVCPSCEWQAEFFNSAVPFSPEEYPFYSRQ